MISAKITEILADCMKVPVGESGDMIEIRCNFGHTFRLSPDDIEMLKVRCPTCKSDIAEISKDIYARKLVDPKVFSICRINTYGKLSLRCVKKNHKLQIAVIEGIICEVPGVCLECVVDSDSDDSHEHNGCCSDADREFENYFDDVADDFGEFGDAGDFDTPKPARDFDTRHSNIPASYFDDDITDDFNEAFNNFNDSIGSMFNKFEIRSRTTTDIIIDQLKFAHFSEYRECKAIAHANYKKFAATYGDAPEVRATS